MTDGDDRATGGPVYSYDDHEMQIVGYAKGLTKREAFAMAAMQGILSKNPVGAERVAETAVEQADALIAALNKPQETKA